MGWTDEFDVWVLCGPGQDGGLPQKILCGLITFGGCFAGFGLTAFVQSTLSFETRKRLLELSHSIGFAVWTLPLLTCSPWAFVFLVMQMYSWGAEPYDNLLEARLWRAAAVKFRQGEWIHYYWLLSCLGVHLWFVGGVSTIMVGMFRPVWYLAAVPGFWFSHLARLAAYKYNDTLASILEVIGICFLILTIVAVVVSESSVFELTWVTVSTIERCTHLPAAYNRDASWMRSYDLWEELERSLQFERQESVKVCLTDDVEAKQPTESTMIEL